MFPWQGKQVCLWEWRVFLKEGRETCLGEWKVFLGEGRETCLKKWTHFLGSQLLEASFSIGGVDLGCQGMDIYIEGQYMGASKIFCIYLLPCFLLENTKKIVFQTSNLLLVFQKKKTFSFFSWASLASLQHFKSICVISFGLEKVPQKYPQKLCHFLGVRDDYENKFHYPKNYY